MINGLPNDVLDQARAAISSGVAGGGGGQLPAWIPDAPVVVAVTAVVAGLVVWLFGGRLIKAAFLAVGGIAGSALGAVYVPVMTESIAGIPAAYVGMGAGFLLGVVAAALLFRFAMAMLTAGVLGMAGVLVAITTLSHVPGAIPPGESMGMVDGRVVIVADGSADSARRLVRDRIGSLTGVVKGAASRSLIGAASAPIAGEPDGSGDLSGDAGASGLAQPAGSKDEVDTTTEAAQEAARAIYDLIVRRWQSLPDRSRLVVAGSWLAGALAGFALGILVPRKAAVAVSSLTGAAMILAGGVWLADRYTGLGAWLAGVGALGYLGAWMATSAVGLMFQSRSRKGPSPGGASGQPA